MSEPTYSIALSETERTALAKVLGALVTKLINAPLQLNAQLDPKSGTNQARAILSPSSYAAPPAILSPPSSPAPPAVAQSTAPIAVRDRWARDRKGNEVPNPDGCETITVHIWKTEQKGKFLKVTYQSDGRGYVDANCFDPQLWPWIVTLKAEGKLARLYVVRKDKYLNIVGVWA